MDLRPYQIEALERTRQSFGRGHRNVLLVLPTGGGKTRIAAAIADHWPGPVVFIADRQELVDQAAGAMPSAVPPTTRWGTRSAFTRSR